jgi:hypothetical protein
MMAYQQTFVSKVSPGGLLVKCGTPMAVEVLPALSTANVRELLKAVLPLPQLTPEQATQRVITHLVNRARSTSSRLKSQGTPFGST